MRLKLAKISKIKKLSPVWIFPAITALIGFWVLYTHFAQQGKSFTLITSDANGVVAGRTIIKSRNVQVGKVDKVTLSPDLKKVLIKGSIDRNMSNLLKEDSIFWIVKPQIDIEGVSGLNTLLSGVYIEIMPGIKKEAPGSMVYPLADTPPIAALNAEGMRIELFSKQRNVVLQGAPVLFRGFRVGNVEQAQFDVNDRVMKYRIFIEKPYAPLLTKNIRFWREGGFNLRLSAKGASLDIPSLNVLFGGGISFDIPKGARLGSRLSLVDTKTMIYELYSNKESIQDSQYTKYDRFVLLFYDSISGLTDGAPVKYHGVRLGTVEKAPYFNSDIDTRIGDTFTVPVLVKIEPQRIPGLQQKYNISKLLIDDQKKGLRASIRSSNLFTGSVYVDLDFYPDYKSEKYSTPAVVGGYRTIATAPSGFAQIQKKILQTLNTVNQLPLQQTFTELNQAIGSVNKTVKSIQPGMPLNQSLENDLNKLQRVLDQFSLLLKTLNDKSNALIFAAPAKIDPMPKAKGRP